MRLGLRTTCSLWLPPPLRPWPLIRSLKCFGRKPRSRRGAWCVWRCSRSGGTSSGNRAAGLKSPAPMLRDKAIGGSRGSLGGAPRDEAAGPSIPMAGGAAVRRRAPPTSRLGDPPVRRCDVKPAYCPRCRSRCGMVRAPLGYCPRSPIGFDGVCRGGCDVECAGVPQQGRSLFALSGDKLARAGAVALARQNLGDGSRTAGWFRSGSRRFRATTPACCPRNRGNPARAPQVGLGPL